MDRGRATLARGWGCGSMGASLCFDAPPSHRVSQTLPFHSTPQSLIGDCGGFVPCGPGGCCGRLAVQARTAVGRSNHGMGTLEGWLDGTVRDGWVCTWPDCTSRLVISKLLYFAILDERRTQGASGCSEMLLPRWRTLHAGRKHLSVEEAGPPDWSSRSFGGDLEGRGSTRAHAIDTVMRDL